MHTDTIFSFSASFEKTPAYVADYGKYKYKLDNSNSFKSFKIVESSIMESNDWLFLKIIFPENGFSYRNPDMLIGNACYSKKEGRLKALNYDSRFGATGFKNDIDNGAPFWPVALVNEKLYQVVDAATFIEWSELAQSEQMKKIAAKLSEESNPVLVVATLLKGN